VQVAGKEETKAVPLPLPPAVHVHCEADGVSVTAVQVYTVAGLVLWST
jgi:hypothetical protein